LSRRIRNKKAEKPENPENPKKHKKHKKSKKPRNNYKGQIEEMSLHLCHPYVWEDPRYIFKSFMYDGSCMSELVNRVVLVYLMFLVAGFILGSATNISGMPLLFGIIATCFLLPTFMKMRQYNQMAEGFADNDSGEDDSGAEKSGQKGIQLEKVTQAVSSARNPFQNVMPDEYKYAPTRAAAPSVTTTEAKVALDSMFRTQWYSDPTDVFGKTQGQRMFVTQPNTTIPNDQESYQSWLYKIPGKTCKEGNYDACYAGTGGAVIPWLDNV
jgi:hypothetical protein